MENGVYNYYEHVKLDRICHGTGDIYASATLGAMMRGLSDEDSLSVAVDFTLECMKETMRDKDHRFYGVNFESALSYYIELINKKLGETR